MTLRVLDLFSGTGAMSLGLEMAGMKTVAFCETNPFCRRWLRHAWPGVPVFGDIRKLTKGKLEGVPGEKAGAIDVICGGFPCQPFSLAGKRRGQRDDRYLWPEMLRIIDEVRPNYVIGENVAGIIGMALDTVLSDLEGIGYSCQAFVIPACAAGAAHKRNRVWIVAHNNMFRCGMRRLEGQGIQRSDKTCDEADSGGQNVADATGEQNRRVQQGGLQPKIGASGSDVADADRQRLEEQRRAEPAHEGQRRPQPERGCERSPQSRVGLPVDGPSPLVARHGVLPVAPYGAEQYPWEEPRLVFGKALDRWQKLQALGNAVYWPVVYQIGKAIMRVEKNIGEAKT